MTPTPTSFENLMRWVLPAGLGVAILFALVLSGVREGGASLFLAAMLLGAGAGALGTYVWRGRAAPSTRQTAPLVQAAEPAPAKSLQELTPFMEGLPEAALLIDRDGRIAVSNPEARHQLKFEAQGLRLSSILRHPEILDAAQAAAVDGISRVVEYENTAPVEEYYRVYVAPIAWGDETAALMIFHDQTTLILTERMRADFLANASHELKTPVTSLSLLIETVSGSARDDAVARDRFLGMMDVQVQRMRRLIDDLLSLSKIELNEHVPPSERTNLVEIIREAIDAVGAIARDRGVMLTMKGADTPQRVVGDRFQLIQVAQNLIDNAVKYSPSGTEVVIEIGAAESREAAAEVAGRRWPEAAHISLLTPPPIAGRSYAYFRVADAGPGIPKRYLPRLSERFFRVERDQGAEKAGTGLGLAICKHIVNRHRGGFVVESEAGKGAAFAVYFERIGPDRG